MLVNRLRYKVSESRGVEDSSTKGLFPLLPPAQEDVRIPAPPTESKGSNSSTFHHHGSTRFRVNSLVPSSPTSQTLEEEDSFGMSSEIVSTTSRNRSSVGDRPTFLFSTAGSPSLENSGDFPSLTNDSFNDDVSFSSSHPSLSSASRPSLCWTDESVDLSEAEYYPLRSPRPIIVHPGSERYNQSPRKLGQPFLLPPLATRFRETNENGVTKTYRRKKQPTVVLSLDQVLVRISLNQVPQGKFHHSFHCQGNGVYVSYRRGLKAFLRELAEAVEIVLFTDVPKAYAGPILRVLDPHGSLIPEERRFYQEDCTPVTDQVTGKVSYVKDLSALNRSLDRTVIVDSNSESFRWQPYNGIIVPVVETGGIDEIVNRHFLSQMLLPQLWELATAPTVYSVLSEFQFSQSTASGSHPDDILPPQPQAMRQP